MTVATMTADEAYAAISSGAARPGMRVEGVLDYSVQSGRPWPSCFPEDLQVDVLNVAGQSIEALPRGLKVYELDLRDTPVTGLPEGLQIRSRLDLTGCDRLESLPAGLTVGTLILRGCTALQVLPEHLNVWFLDLSECWALERWPQDALIRGGRLQLRGCTALRELPPYITRLSALNVRECPNLRSLPPDLVVTGWIDLAHSGLTSEEMLPVGAASAQLRWAGVNVDRRIAFHPEEIRIDELLEERNAERRRVLLDRYGYGRFLQDAAADLLDSDVDPGGPRQLLRVKLPDDEDLVAMSCFCPSTARQYIIRVPPQTPTCRHAAAWIAGFDDPNDYRPLIET
jgi:hypothetical protein